MATYIRLAEYKSADAKEREFFNNSNRYMANEANYKIIPGKLYAYWILPEVSKAFECYTPLNQVADIKNGMSTTDNTRFVRWWYECAFGNIGIGCESAEASVATGCKWFPYNKGGEYRKWYGNMGLVVNWKNNGQEIKKAAEGASGGRIVSQDYYFMRSVSWSKVSSGKFALRLYPTGFLFDVAGPGIFTDYEMQKYIMGVINSKISKVCLQELYPTMNYEMGQVSSFPILVKEEIKTLVSDIVEDNIQLEKQDWDTYETSWDFKKHFLINGERRLAVAYQKYLENYDARKNKISENERKLNELFLKLYSLDGKMNSDVSDDDITIIRHDLYSDITSLISYAVGCIMGRYSLIDDGVVFAGGVWNEELYSNDYRPCEYGVLPITEDQFFEVDLCTRVIDFIRVVFGEETLNDNLKFIASALKPDSFEAPKKIIRDYMFNDFFDNHYQIYQHRPIYWQLDSGKAGGFRAIVYMHRFTENTLPLVRTEFIQDLRYKYEEEMQRQKSRLEGASSTAESNAIKKDIAALDKKIVECAAYDELLNHATSSIQNYLFDLDDGVKTNYAKFLSIDGDKNSNILTVVKL